MLNDLIELIMMLEGEEKKEEVKPVVKRKGYGVKDIKQILVNAEKKTTTIVWLDDTVTMCKCCEGDTYDEFSGIAIAYLKKQFDSVNKMTNYLESKTRRIEPKKKTTSKKEKTLASLKKNDASPKESDK